MGVSTELQLLNVPGKMHPLFFLLGGSAFFHT